jgi:hypothetical protein
MIGSRVQNVASMPLEPLNEIEPLSYTNRRRTFYLLLALFVLSLPFLFLYATGYRFDLEDRNAIVGTGGIYVAAERTGAEIYIDDELVRETRVFRTAFYAQNLDPRTHRVHVQKEDHHTWVKELPVTSHRVTEAQAFNLPIVPEVRLITPWVSATGSPVVHAEILRATTTQVLLSTTTKSTSTFSMNPEYTSILSYFVASGTATVTPSLLERIENEISVESLTGSSSPVTTEEATTTKVAQDARLSFKSDGALYAEWVGGREQMPYYYCAKEFPRYSSTSAELPPNVDVIEPPLEEEGLLEGEVFVHPIQAIPIDTECTPEIQMGALGEAVMSFDFLPGSTDLVLLSLTSGIYVSEIDNRAWQNIQPLILGENLSLHVENGNIYVYDGNVIYQIVSEI